MKYLLKKLSLFTLSIVFISTLTFIYLPGKVAKAMPVEDIPTEIQTAVSAAANIATQMMIKELLDMDKIIRAIIRSIARAIIRGIIRSTIQWINSGFQGKPGFLQDPQRFLLNIADVELGRLIQGSELNFVCSPFQLNIKKALILSRKQSFGSRTSCTLSGVSNNMNNFISGVNNQFGQYGGWTAWDTMTTQPQNNPYGAYALASAELNIRIQNSQGQQIKLLDWGKGFLSWRNQECVSKADAATVEATANGGGDLLSKPDYSNCKIETPGSLIEDQLALVVGDDVRQLELAQDFNDLITALIGQLVTSAVGLLGSTAAASGGADQSYLGVLGQQDSTGLLNTKDKIISSANSSINDERSYISANQTLLSRIDRTETALWNLIACETGTTSTSTISYASNATWAQDKIRNILPTIRAKYQTNIDTASTSISVFQKIISDAQKATSNDPGTFTPISNRLISALSTAHNSTSVTVIRNQDSYDLNQTLTPMNTEAQTRLNDCQMSKYGTTGSTVFGF